MFILTPIRLLKTGNKEELMIKWGIVGAGIVSEKFVRAANFVQDSIVYAVASKTNADKFAQKHNVPVIYKDYNDLANDKEIDAVYVSTINPMHYEIVMMMLNKNKAVLCEKPAGMCANETYAMAELANRKQVFFMEAMWTKFLPAILHLKEIIHLIGCVRRVKAEFCINVEAGITHRLFNKSLGGGALLDMGIYPLSFIHMLLGVPDEINPTLYVGEYGVDEIGEITLLYKNAIAQASFATRCDGLDYAVIYGDKGKIEIPNFHKATRLNIKLSSGVSKEYVTSHLLNGFEFEIQEAVKCIKNGEIESKIHTHNDCIEISKIIDYAYRKII